MSIGDNGGIRPFPGYSGVFKGFQSEQARVEQFLTKPTSATGRELTINAGEVIIPVTFGVWFIERPTMTFGGEMDAGDFVEAQKFPTVSGVVVEWTRSKPDRSNGGYYVGARVCCVTTGRTEQRIWLHWRAEGKALANPAVSLGGEL